MLPIRVFLIAFILLFSMGILAYQFELSQIDNVNEPCPGIGCPDIGLSTSLSDRFTLNGRSLRELGLLVVDAENLILHYNDAFWENEEYH